MTSLLRPALLFLTIFCIDSDLAGANEIKPWYETAIDDSRTALRIRTEVGEEQSLYDRSYALLIGEVNYQKWDSLRTVPGELADLTKALERQHFKVTLYFDLDGAALEGAVDQFIRRRGAVPESRIVVYISAHGFTRDVLLRRHGYILPIDSPKEGSPDTEILAKALPMNMFEAWAQAPDPRHMFFFFDACFSGAFFGYEGSSVESDQVSRKPNAEGFTLDRNGHLVAPPTQAKGVEASNILARGPHSAGRQFLSSGDAYETVPGRSIMAQLLVGILNDEITRPQINNDHFTTGEEIGTWISNHARNLEKALFKNESPPSPVFGRLPGSDSLYKQGDIVFLRNDLAGADVVQTVDDVAAWQAALSKPISIDPILTGQAELAGKEAKAEAARQIELADEAARKAESLQLEARNAARDNRLHDQSAIQGGDLQMQSQAVEEQLRRAATNAQEAANEAHRQAVQSMEKVQAAEATSAQILASVEVQRTSILKAAGAAVLPDSALTSEQEIQLSQLIELLSSDKLSPTGIPLRRDARDALARWLAGLSPGQQATTVERLLNQLSQKSYRFQLGVAMAIGKQSPLFVTDLESARAEITAAERSKGGDKILKGQLVNAARALGSAKQL